MTFASMFTLRRHLVTHRSTKEYVCHVCRRQFALPQYLKDHLNVHSGARPYVCDHPGCDNKFKQSSRLSMHKRVHRNKLFIVKKVKKRAKKSINCLKEPKKPKKLLLNDQDRIEQFSNSLPMPKIFKRKLKKPEMFAKNTM